MFNFFVNDLDVGAECTLSKLADDSKLGGVFDTAETHAAIQRNLERLEKHANRNFAVFNKEKWEVLRTRRIHSTHQYELGGSPSWKPAWQKRTLGFWWTPS